MPAIVGCTPESVSCINFSSLGTVANIGNAGIIGNRCGGRDEEELSEVVIIDDEVACLED